jgi:hypothetical protein
MFQIPLYLFLIVYLAVLLICGILFLVNIHHLTATGTFTSASISLTLIITGLAGLVLFVTIASISNIDWRQSIPLGSALSVNSSDNFFSP